MSDGAAERYGDRWTYLHRLADFCVFRSSATSKVIPYGPDLQSVKMNEIFELLFLLDI